MEMSDQLYALDALPPERAPTSHFIEGWMGLTGGLDAVRETFLGSTGNQIPDVQCSPVAIPTYFPWLTTQITKLSETSLTV
jgi:hypothetical protein